jgi:hypothetical protein
MPLYAISRKEGKMPKTFQVRDMTRNVGLRLVESEESAEKVLLDYLHERMFVARHGVRYDRHSRGPTAEVAHSNGHCTALSGGTKYAAIRVDNLTPHDVLDMLHRLRGETTC